MVKYQSCFQSASITVPIQYTVVNEKVTKIPTWWFRLLLFPTNVNIGVGWLKIILEKYYPTRTLN